MSHFQALVQRLREDDEFRAALQGAATPDARLAALRDAGLQPPSVDDVLEGVAGGATICVRNSQCKA